MNKLFECLAAERMKKHLMLDIDRQLCIGYHQIRQDRVCSTALLAFDAKNSENLGSLRCFQLTVVVAVADQASGMTAAAVDTVTFQLCCDIVVFFGC